MKKRLKKIFLAAVLGLACLGAALWMLAPDPTREVLNWAVSPVLLDQRGQLINVRLSAEGEWCLPIALEDMGEWLPKVLVAVEDKRFMSHGGVDFLALGRAIWQNASQGRVVSGASTITTQLVRLSHPRPRTIRAKLYEFVGAWKLENTLSKEQILEYYLNRAPFGGPIRGVEAASRLYFGKRAKDLSLGEAALLVGMLKGPTLYRPDRNPKGAQERRRQIILKVAAQTGFPEELTALALEEPLPAFNTSMPSEAWHFADLAFRTLPRNGGVVRSTLDLHVQARLEQTLLSQLEKAGDQATAAGIVVENRTGRIVAYVGNARFDPRQDREWVDCAIAPRSPGSTLKPFAYLAAMEAGRIIPASLVADTPLRLGGEAPRNFDRRYRGPVRIATALASSLNAPAVRVQRMVGVRKVLASLREAGFAHLSREDSEYGDSLVLGAGEVTLLELARSYTALASLGLDRPLLIRQPLTPAESLGRSLFPALESYRPWNDPAHGREEVSATGPLTPLRRFVPAHMPSGLAPVEAQLRASAYGEVPETRQLYGRAGCFLIADILSDSARLPFIVQITQAREGSPVAFKTGTSYGMRDAWTVAWAPSHTVAVWFGKSNGGPDPRFLGISLAAPAATGLVRQLAPGKDAPGSWYEQPADVSRVLVCTLSGRAPSAFCPATRMEWNIPSVWRTVPCDMHVQRGGRTEVVWPPELEDFARKRQAREDLSRSALILSPMGGTKYLITPGVRNQPISLKAEGVDYPVHWYVQGEYLGEQPHAEAPLYWLPIAGKHTFSLLDKNDRVAVTSVEIVDLAARREEAAPLLLEQ